MVKWRRALVPSVLLSALFALLIGAAVIIGKQFPPRNTAILARHPACSLPCLLGVTPGSTSRAAAISTIGVIAEFPPDQAGTSFGFSIPDDSGSFITGLFIFDDQDIVQYVRLYTRRWNGLGITLGDLMPDVPPSGVYQSCRSVYPVRLLLAYDGSPQISLAAVVDRVVSPRSPVSMIAVSSQPDMFAQTLATVASGGCHIPSEWQGFGSLWLYNRPMIAPA